MPAAEINPIDREAEHSLDVGFGRFHFGHFFCLLWKLYSTREPSVAKHYVARIP